MTLSLLIDIIKSDIKSYNGFGFFKFIGVFFFNASFRLILNYRLGFYFHKKKGLIFKVLTTYYRYRQITKRNCQISYSAKLGRNIIIAHPIGIIIGAGSIIEDNVKIWQQVTLGSHGRLNSNSEYPIIKSNARLYAGAKIFGKVEIGENSIIAANAVVNSSIPPNTIAGGIPARVLKTF